MTLSIHESLRTRASLLSLHSSESGYYQISTTHHGLPSQRQVLQRSQDSQGQAHLLNERRPPLNSPRFLHQPALRISRRTARGCRKSTRVARRATGQRGGRTGAASLPLAPPREPQFVAPGGAQRTRPTPTLLPIKAALSLSRLAEELGVQTPSLYNHVNGLPGLQRELAVLNARHQADRPQAFGAVARACRRPRSSRRVR